MLALVLCARFKTNHVQNKMTASTYACHLIQGGGKQARAGMKEER